MNLSKLLKPHGTMICMESASSYNSPYLMYSPSWFYDFFVVNKYKSVGIYLASYKKNHLIDGPWKMDLVNVQKSPNGPTPEAIFGCHLILLSIATKGSGSTNDIQPIQYQYRTSEQLKSAFKKNENKILINDFLVDKKNVNYENTYLVDAGVLCAYNSNSTPKKIKFWNKLLKKIITKCFEYIQPV